MNSNSAPTTATAAPSIAATLAAAAAASQMNPFYIDKIFNFQNMFLFSNAAAAAGANHMSPDLAGIPNVGPFINNRSNSPLLSTTTTTSTTSIAPDFHSFMKQNLMQNFFSYYSNGAFSNPNNPIGTAVNDSNKNGSKSTNFSIDNILSSSNANNTNRKSNEPNSLAMNTAGFNLPPPPPLPFASSSCSSSPAQYAAHQNYDQSLKHLAKHSSNSSKHFNHHYSKMKQTNPPMALTALIPPSLASMISSASSSSSNSSNMSRLNSIKQFGPHKAAMMTNSYKHSSQDSNQSSSNSNSQGVSVKSKNAKKYKCDLCGRGFSRSNTLITHRVSFFFLFYYFFIWKKSIISFPALCWNKDRFFSSFNFFFRYFLLWS